MSFKGGWTLNQSHKACADLKYGKQAEMGDHMDKVRWTPAFSFFFQSREKDLQAWILTCLNTDSVTFCFPEACNAFPQEPSAMVMSDDIEVFRGI